MPNYFAIGFFGILTLTGAGMEYHRQSMQAGVPMSEFGPAQFIESIKTSMSEGAAKREAVKQEKHRIAQWKVALHDHLPEAPEGWSRRGFDEGDNRAIIPNKTSRTMTTLGGGASSSYLSNARLENVDLQKSAGTSGIHNMMKNRSAEEVIKSVSERSWVYERGDETIFVELRLKPAVQVKSMMDAAVARMNDFKNAGSEMERNEGFALIDGVGFTELLGSMIYHQNDQRPTHYRILRASIGLDEEVQLRVHANASTDATKQVLSAIDFEALNGLLARPMSHIGVDADQIPEGAEIDIVHAMSALKAEAQFLLATERNYIIDKKMSGGALSIAKFSRGIGSADQVGSVQSLRDVIHNSYREAMIKIVNGAQYEQAQARLISDISSAPKKEATAKIVNEEPIGGTMSKALREELENEQQVARVVKKPIVAKVLSKAPAKKEEKQIKVNRLGGANKSSNRNKSGCSGGSFCKVGN